MINPEAFSARLLATLTLKHMTCQELATHCNVSKSSISRYLSGERLPKFTTVIKMAEALGVSYLWLSGLDAEPNESAVVVIKDDNPIDLSKLTRINRIRVISYYQGLLDSQNK